MLSKNEVFEAVSAAFAAPFEPARASGCGRAYVCVSGSREEINAVAAAARKIGLIFQRKAHYGLRNALYVGYDNADGRALGKAAKVAEVLSARGLKSYDEACGD